jgi:hypothetical protein
LRWDAIGGKVPSAGRRAHRETLGDGPEEVDMGRYVVLLIAPFIIGVLIAAGLVLIERLRRRRDEAADALFDETLEDSELLAEDPDALEHEVTRRIAS